MLRRLVRKQSHSRIVCPPPLVPIIVFTAVLLLSYVNQQLFMKELISGGILLGLIYIHKVVAGKEEYQRQAHKRVASEHSKPAPLRIVKSKNGR